MTRGLRHRRAAEAASSVTLQTSASESASTGATVKSTTGSSSVASTFSSTVSQPSAPSEAPSSFSTHSASSGSASLSPSSPSTVTTSQSTSSGSISSTVRSASTSSPSTSAPGGPIKVQTQTSTSSIASSSSVSSSSVSSSSISPSFSQSASSSDSGSGFTTDDGSNTTSFSASQPSSTGAASLTTFVFPHAPPSSTESSLPTITLPSSVSAPDGPISLVDASSVGHSSLASFIPVTPVTTFTLGNSLALSATQSGTITSASDATSASSGPTSNNGSNSDPSLNASSSSKKNVGAIAGGVVAGLLVLVAIIATMYILNRNRRRRAHAQFAFGAYTGGDSPDSNFFQDARTLSATDVDLEAGAAYFFGGQGAGGYGPDHGYGPYGNPAPGNGRATTAAEMMQVVNGPAVYGVPGPVNYDQPLPTPNFTQPTHAFSGSITSAAGSTLKSATAPVFPKTVPHDQSLHARSDSNANDRAGSGYSIWSDPFRGPAEGAPVITASSHGHAKSNSGETNATGISDTTAYGGIAAAAAAAAQQPQQRDSGLSASSSFYSTLSVSPAQNFLVPDPEADALQSRGVNPVPTFAYTPATPETSRRHIAGQASTSTASSLYSTQSYGGAQMQARGMAVAVLPHKSGAHNSTMQTPGDEVDPFMHAEEVAKRTTRS